MASRARGLGMQVIAHDPFVDAGAVPRGCRSSYCSLDEVLAQADFITLHAPLTAETRHLVGAETIALMRPACGS